MKSISLVQVGFQTGPKHLNAYYLPYSVGTVWTYANTSKFVQENYQVNQIIWRRDPIDQLAPQLAKDDIVLISCYVWNKNYNFSLAQAIKEINSKTTVIIGGPEPAIQDENFFYNNPAIDIVIKLEGELILKNLLENWENKASVAGLLLNKHGQSIDTGLSPRVENLEDLPSPYLTGFFDSIIQDNPDVEWNATLETNRGCPYQCTFCDWGSLTYQKVKKFNLERTFAEIDWIVKNCGFVALTDANFGVFIERDSAIMDYFIESQQKNNNFLLYSINWAKNMKPGVMKIVQRLLDGGPGYGVTLSVQTLTDEVLTNIKRKNMHAENIAEIFSMAEKQGIDAYTDFIYGLPGETLHSWKENFFNMFRQGIHTFFEISVSQLLENAEMTLKQKQEYDIETATIYDFIGGPYNNDAWPESIEVTKSTNTLDNTDMIEGLVYSWFIMTFHIFGWTNLISRFLNKYNNIDYGDFYEDLYSAVKKDSWLSQCRKDVETYWHRWYERGKIGDEDIGGVEIHGWNLFYITGMDIHYSNRYQHMVTFLDNFIKQYNLPSDVHQDLMDTQSALMVDLNNLDQYPKEIKTQHNIYDYVIKGDSLEKSPTNYKVDWTWKKDETFFTKLERVFYQRRSSYSKTQITKIHK